MVEVEPSPLLFVLMPVCNGVAYVEAQVDSLARQTWRPDRLILSDDGSKDASVALVQKVAGQTGLGLSSTVSPGVGLAANVAELIRVAPVGYWAFCDQDDVWHPDRLMRGVTALHGVSGPAAHVVRRLATDAKLRQPQPLSIPKGTSFRRALARNTAPANATLLNPEAARLVKQAAGLVDRLPSCPDWWVYALVLGAGGQIIFDPEPGLYYRQHGQNLFGARRGLGWFRRLLWAVNGTHLRRIREVTFTLSAADHLLTPKNRRDVAVLSHLLATRRVQDMSVDVTKGSPTRKV